MSPNEVLRKEGRKERKGLPVPVPGYRNIVSISSCYMISYSMGSNTLQRPHTLHN